MQSPILVFDHTQKTASVIATGPGLNALVAAQRDQVATSGRPRV